MSVSDLANTSVRALTSAFSKGVLSPVEVLKVVLDHVDRFNGELNALFSIRPEEALAAAQASEKRWRDGRPMGLLDGVPMTVKDSVAMKGCIRP